MQYYCIVRQKQILYYTVWPDSNPCSNHLFSSNRYICFPHIYAGLPWLHSNFNNNQLYQHIPVTDPQRPSWKLVQVRYRDINTFRIFQVQKDISALCIFRASLKLYINGHHPLPHPHEKSNERCASSQIVLWSRKCQNASASHLSMGKVRSLKATKKHK